MSINISQYMDKQPAKIHCGTSLAAVIETLAEHQVSGAAVVDEGDHVIGFVSEQDCLKQLLLSSYHCDQPARVNEVMQHKVVNVAPEHSIIELAENMEACKPKIYPVVSQGVLVGSISRRQVLKALSDHQRQCGLTAQPAH